MLSSKFSAIAAVGFLAGVAPIMGMTPENMESYAELNIDSATQQFVAPDGRAIYFYTGDVNHDQSSYSGGAWPKVMINSGAANSAYGTSSFGTTQDGQLTYQGKPLYFCDDAQVSTCKDGDNWQEVLPSWPFATLSSDSSPPNESHQGCQTESSMLSCNDHGGGGQCAWDPAGDPPCTPIPTEFSSSSGSDCSGLPVHDIAFELAYSPEAAGELCTTENEAFIRCDDSSIVVKISADSASLQYSEGKWKIKNAGITAMEALAGSSATQYYHDASGSGKYYPLKTGTSFSETDFVDLVALDTALGTNASVASCNTTAFDDALEAYENLGTPCEEVGNLRQDLNGPCANSCIDGYERSTGTCKISAYSEDATKSDAEKKTAKYNWFKTLRNAGIKQRTKESTEDFTKRKSKEIKKNTREYFKQKMQDRNDQNELLPAADRKKRHQMRKEERMPLSLAKDSTDFKDAFRDTLRAKFSLQDGQDRDIGIIVGPDNSGAAEAEACVADYDVIQDSDRCITYDAAIDGDTTDVHVLGSDGAYNVGGIQIGAKYVPVVKQTLADADAEHYQMSCWDGSAWAVQRSDYKAGEEVTCTVRRDGVVVAVNTVVGSTATGLVDGDKCDVGHGCVDADEDGACDTPFACEPCAIPEANNAVFASVCQEQICSAGEGAWIVEEDNSISALSLTGFNVALNASNTNNDNCAACPSGKFSLADEGVCNDHDICKAGEFASSPGTSQTQTVCDACNSTSFHAQDPPNDESCTQHSQCINEQYKALKIAGTNVTDAVCCDSADKDDICDDVDDCFITSCTDKQLTDAYALLTSAGECSGSRRAQSHTEVFETCYTSGCASQDDLNAMLNKFGTCDAL